MSSIIHFFYFSLIIVALKKQEKKKQYQEFKFYPYHEGYSFAEHADP